MNNRIFVAALITMAALAGAAALAADGDSPDPGFAGEHGMHAPAMPMPPSAPGMMGAEPFPLMMLVERLDLDKDQRGQAGRIMDDTMPKMRELMFRKIDSHKALEAFADSGSTDAKALRKLADEQGRITADMTYLCMKARADFRALLTDEQKQKLDEFDRHKFGRHHHHRRERDAAGQDFRH
jgi:Spy/CpxP family protein refolding chaperone